ncbi:MAG: hypothetical protein GWO39_00640, partial [Gammaproteobacteria bacterium]|nr:hypothetical protein [Gammaproteobacteria bacterium]NIV19296.1 hypothetical protein [Gammaproteobacteria bacterium]NIY30929.1 hypothetical protein [Gammaproteobacteria bacterium]
MLLLGLALLLPAPAWAGRVIPLDEIMIAVDNKALTRREVLDLKRLQEQELRGRFQGEELRR